MDVRNLESHEVRQAARGRWLAILSQLAPELECQLARLGRHGPCPVHGGRDGFRLFRDAAESGGGICNTCGPRTDGFELLMWLKGWSFPETLLAVAETLQAGMPLPVVTRPEIRFTRTVIERRRSRLKMVWRQAVPVDDPIAAPLHQYLENRHIGLDILTDIRDLRFHPRLPYWEDKEIQGRFPAMLALVRDNAGKVVSIHRTWIKDGAKAPVHEPRKLMPPLVARMKGAAVRLAPFADELGVCEGIETAMAVMQKTAMPVWPATSWTFLANFKPHPSVCRLTIWADKDRTETGLNAAERLKKHLDNRDIQITIKVPEGPVPEGAKSLDWNDVFRK
ncbi:MAG TPA: zinc-binding protein [Rhodobacteraceae bacterium]|nr:zinc-binding protein [Paracoccaceae bacterium]